MTPQPQKKLTGANKQDGLQVAVIFVSFDCVKIPRFVDSSDVWHNELSPKKRRDRIVV